MRLNTTIGNVHIKLNTDRLERNIKVNAQRKLGEDVLKDSTYYVPVVGVGHLSDSGRAVDGGEAVVWDGPYAHYQYVGYVRTDEKGSTFVKKDEKKPILTSRPLEYQSKAAEKEWFEAAKRDHLQEWLEDVRKEVGKG